MVFVQMGADQYVARNVLMGILRTFGPSKCAYCHPASVVSLPDQTVRPHVVGSPRTSVAEGTCTLPMPTRSSAHRTLPVGESASHTVRRTTEPMRPIPCIPHANMWR